MSIENTTGHNMTSDRLAAARAAAKLKREKKAAAVIACKNGKERVAKEREMEQQRWLSFMDEERVIMDKKVAKVRKAMGVRKNEDNPVEILRLMEQWKIESMMKYPMKSIS